MSIQKYLKSLIDQFKNCVDQGWIGCRFGATILMLRQRLTPKRSCERECNVTFCLQLYCFVLPNMFRPAWIPMWKLVEKSGIIFGATRSWCCNTIMTNSKNRSHHHIEHELLHVFQQQFLCCTVVMHTINLILSTRITTSSSVIGWLKAKKCIEML